MARVGDMHRRLNQFDKCIDILYAHPIDPHNQFIISNLASAYRSKRQYKKSGRPIGRGLEFNPDNSNILVFGNAITSNNNLKKVEVIRKQLFIHPNHVPSLIVLTESLLLQHTSMLKPS